MRIEITSSKGHKQTLDVRDHWTDDEIECYIQDVVIGNNFDWSWRRVS